MCFFGDSMTAGGAWIAEIYQNLIDSYPHRGIKLYNCGVAGDKSSHAIDRLYGDCLIYNPDCVCVMFGINDIDINAYLENDGERQRSAMELYEKSMRKIVSECKAGGAEVILCTPPPYDEISDVPAANCRCGSGIDNARNLLKSLLRNTAACSRTLTAGLKAMRISCRLSDPTGFIRTKTAVI